MKALVYQGPGRKALEDRPIPEIAAPTDAIVKISKTTICGTDLHILKGDVPSCKPGRILGHEGVGVVSANGRGGDAIPSRRPCPDLLHLLLRQMRILPQGDVFPLRDGRLDPGQRDRRHPGGIRPDPPCRHQPLSHPRRRGRGGAGHAERHLAHRLRMRRPQRQGPAGLDGGDRRRGPHRPCHPADRPVLFAGRDHHDRPRREPPGGGEAVRRDRDRECHGRQGGDAGDEA